MPPDMLICDDDDNKHIFLCYMETDYNNFYFFFFSVFGFSFTHFLQLIINS